MIDVSLIGTGGMVPLPNRFLTAMAARIGGSMLLIDCGEGTQVTLKQLGWGFKNLDIICFTHFHADHIAGLPGLLLTVGNAGRTEPLSIFGPAGVKEIVDALCAIAPYLPFPLTCIELPRHESTVACGRFNISALPLDHTANCFGYCLTLNRTGRFDVQKAKSLNIPMTLWSRLQKGETISQDGRTYAPDMVLGAKRKGIKISYITDTRPLETIPRFIAGSDLFICEGLYGNAEYISRAQAHKHMIFSEAAQLAKDGGVKELWLTHFSPALSHPESELDAAKNIFENTKTGCDRMTKTIRFES